MSDAATRLANIRQRIARSAKAARRNPGDVTLIAVTKQRSSSEIEALIEAGMVDFGENRVQEVEEKWPPLRDQYPGLKLHMIGRLQSNKASEAVRQFDSIHSLDRPSLLEALVAAAD